MQVIQRIVIENYPLAKPVYKKTHLFVEAFCSD